MAKAAKTAKKATKKVAKKAPAKAKAKVTKTAAKTAAKTATKTAAKTATKKTETMTTRQLGAELAVNHELSNKAANAILDDMAAIITKQLKKGVRVRLNGLGILQVRKRAARMGRNPATGEAIKIKASKKVAFRASKDLKEAV
jgi:DNA-binding protein HU-beta